jgi:hypothetical protein
VNPAGRPGPFTVRLTEPARVALARLIRRAQRYGLADRFTAALRWSEQTLIDRPLSWGEPRMHFDGLRLTAFHQIHDQLHVVYTVHDSEPFVWITHIGPVLEHPLLQGHWNGDGQ